RTWHDVDSLRPDGVVNVVVRKGQEPVATQIIYYHGELTELTEMQQVAANAAAHILESRLLDSLRQGMGATYTAQAGTELYRVPRLSYQSAISFQSSPAQA